MKVGTNYILGFSKPQKRLCKKQLTVLKNSIMSFQQHQPNIETALGIVFDFLENPLKRWENGDIRTKKLVLSLVFEQKLVYSRKSGFETAFLSLPLRVFTFPESQNELVVEMSGKTSNRLKHYLSEFWQYYQTSPKLRLVLESIE